MILRVVAPFVVFLFVINSAQARVYQGSKTKGISIDGLQQTLLSQLMTGPEGDDFSVELPPNKHMKRLFQQLHEFAQLPNRTFHLKLKKYARSKHLVVVIPGFGASRTSGEGAYISELIHRDGYVTLTSNSPAAPEFIKHSSTYGYPGVQKWDALDLYDMIVASREKLEKQQGFKFEKVSLVGISLGSLNAAHVLAVDNRHKKINFHRVFSLNPPISNVYGATVLDSMIRGALPEREEFKLDVKLSALTSAFASLLQEKLKTSEFEYVDEAAIQLTEELIEQEWTLEELKFLVGYAFKPVIDHAMIAGIQRSKEEKYGTRFSRSKLPIEFFSGFLQIVTYTNYRIFERHMTPADDKFKYGVRQFPHYVMTELESIRNIAPRIQGAKYHLITWRDDFLLRPEDPQWIQTTFSGGDKGHSKIFERGGHLGGFHQTAFQAYLLNNLL